MFGGGVVTDAPMHNTVGLGPQPSWRKSYTGGVEGGKCLFVTVLSNSLTLKVKDDWQFNV